jgi:predicted alpha/beta superfamily hydrolase
MEHMMTATSSRFGLFNTEAIIHTSVSNGEEYQIGIWFPFSYYNSDQTYPVLYLTDGDYLFGLATGLVPTLIGTQEIPEILVVGIGYNQLSSYTEFSKLRELDMLPPGCVDASPDSHTPQFLGFLEQELFPLIETRYRGSPDDRALYGFSVGGFFTLYTMLTRPGLFKRYIVASGTWPGAASFLMTCELDLRSRQIFLEAKPDNSTNQVIRDWLVKWEPHGTFRYLVGSQFLLEFLCILLTVPVFYAGNRRHRQSL